MLQLLAPSGGSGLLVALPGRSCLAGSGRVVLDVTDGVEETVAELLERERGQVLCETLVEGGVAAFDQTVGRQQQGGAGVQ